MTTRKMVSGFGQLHTNEADPDKPEKSLRKYVSIDLEGIRALVDKPQCVNKTKAQWMIPSALHSRSHAEQEKNGEFWTLWADMDKDPIPFDQVQGRLIWGVIGAHNHEIYHSASARQDYQKGRIIVPLAKPLCGSDWVIVQEIFNDKLEAAGIIPDRASERAGQLCYLPNQGAFYQPLSKRDEDLFDPLNKWAEEIAQKRQALADKVAEVERRKAEALERRQLLHYEGSAHETEKIVR